MRALALALALAGSLALQAGCGEDLDAMVPQPEPGALVIPVRVVLGAGVEPARARAVVTEAQAFLGGCGLTLREAAPAVRVPLQELLPGSLESVRSPQDVQTQTLEPLRAFLREQAGVGMPYVNLVLLQRIAPPGGLATKVLGELDGLGLSPEAPAVAALDLPTSFTPTAFAALAPSAAAHELGHALGLGHRDGAVDNLMASAATRRSHCVLDDDQRKVIRAAVERRVR